jgi:hypothetical protein
MTVSPAYGADYKSQKEATEAWDKGKDFIIQDITHRYCGKPCSSRDFPVTSGEVIFIRYNSLRDIFRVQ